MKRYKTQGTPAVPPARTRPVCKQCGGPWSGTHLLLCDACEEAHLDLMRDDDLRESDNEIVL